MFDPVYAVVQGDMEITTRGRPEGLGIDVAGCLVAGGPEFAFAAAVRRAIDAGHSGLVVNLAGVSVLDAAGIGAIIAALVAARDRGLSLTVEGATPRVRTLLTVTGVWGTLAAAKFRDKVAARSLLRILPSSSQRVTLDSLL